MPNRILDLRACQAAHPSGSSGQADRAAHPGCDVKRSCQTAMPSGLPIPVRGLILDKVDRRRAGSPRGRSRAPPACPSRLRIVWVHCMLLDRKYIPHLGTPNTADTIFKGFIGTRSHCRQTCRCLVLPVLRLTPISGSIELNGPEYRLRIGLMKSLTRSARKSKLFFD